MPNYPRYAVLPASGTLFNLDSTNGIYLQEIDLDSSPDMALDSWDVARKDGAHVVSTTYKAKKIPLKGTVAGSTFSDLNAKLDAFKTNCCSNSLALYCDDGVTCKLFKVALTGMASFNRSKKGPVAAEFSMTYQVLDEPYGQASTFGGTATTITAINNTGVTVDIYNVSTTFLGSAPPAALVQITVSTPGDLTSLQFSDITNSRTLSITPSGGIKSGDIILINTLTPSVTLNNEVVAFTGQFPAFQPNVISNMTVYAYTLSGYALDQSQTLTNNTQILYKYLTHLEQSFTTSAYLGGAAPISRISFIANIVGAPTSALFLNIFTDNGSGTAPNTQLGPLMTIPVSAFSSIFQYINVAITGLPVLTASTKYWFVLHTDVSGSDINNYYQIRSYANTPIGYAAGAVYKSQDGGSTRTVVPNTSLAFKTFYAAIGQQNSAIDYTVSPYIETFATTTKKDAANTNANWNTSVPILQMTGGTTNVSTGYVSATDHTGNYTLNNGTGSSYGIAASFQATKTGTLQTVTLTMLRGSVTANPFTVQVASTLPSGSGFPFIGSQDTTGIQGNLTTSYAAYTFTVNAPVTAGTTYYVELLYPSASPTGYIQLQGGGLGGGALNLYTSAGTLATANTNISLDITHTEQYATLSYATQERATTLELAATNADILSVSQVTNTILLNGATYYGQFSVDGGTTWLAMARDTNPFDTDNIPPVAGTTLRMRWLLQNNVTITTSPYVTGTNLYWKKGISLDATTSYGTQSFTPTSSNTMGRMDLFIGKIGTVGVLNISIQTDASGSPSGTPITNGTTSIPAASILSTLGWVSTSFATPPNITSGTKYWIVISLSGTLNGSNRVMALANNNGYPTGAMKKSLNSGTAWNAIASNESLLFRIFNSNGNNFVYNMNVGYIQRYA